jgi:CheY-like chemotaxis protein
MPHPRTKAPVQVLLVEDNASEAALVRIAIEAAQANAKSCGMHLVSDGYQAADFLRRKNSYRNAPRPDLVILDLNLPQKHSLDVLREIKSDADLKRIAVLVLSSSRDERDIRTAYDQQANCCLDKPVDFDRFHDLVRAIEFFCTAPATAPC